MYEAFISKRFAAGTLAVIEQANAIIEEYQEQGFVLTLRQLYYQFVARGLIPNAQREYDRLSAIISDARLAGLIDWAAIEDRTRSLVAISTWDSPEQILDAVAQQYKQDVWITQPARIEVWVEKEALTGVVAPICRELRMPYFACRGYTSQSAQYEASKRLARYIDNNQRVVILHLGDHDPSGIDMSRDNRDRMELFLTGGGADFQLIRLALNFNQVQQYNPPPNPAKLTDSRAQGYIAEHGGESWELDALDPRTIAALIRDNVERIYDAAAFAAALAEEAEQRSKLAGLSRHL